MAARLLNVLLGAWLFVSAFVWTHSSAQLTNTWILGVLCVIFALAATRLPQARFLNTALAAWLFVSAFILPGDSRATVWNNALVAIAILLVSLTAGELPARTARTA